MRGAAAGFVVLLASSTAAEAFAQTVAGAVGPLATADTLVKVVGGAVATVVTVLGLPLVYQTFRKTQAEITKINLEAAKLAREAAGVSTAASLDEPQDIRISLEGDNNVVTIATDPRLKGPLLVLIDALIAVIFSQIVYYAVGFVALFMRLPDFLHGLVMAGVYAGVFLPVLKEALRVKKYLGAEQDVPAVQAGPNVDSGGRPRWRNPFRSAKR